MQRCSWCLVPLLPVPALLHRRDRAEHDASSAQADLACSFVGSAMAAEEKAAIRPKLLAMVDEPDRVVSSLPQPCRALRLTLLGPLQLAKNVALCIAKIARLDYGIDW